MFCENCGKQLIRGYSFCHECGSPVPPEVLEEGGLPARGGNNSEEGQTLSEQAADETSDITETAAEVQASMPGIEPLNKNESEETLVYCPNCGVRIQKNKDFCEKCGMRVGDKPTNSVPLINTHPINLDGSPNEFGGSVDDLSANDLFGTESYSQSDIEALNQQMTNFGASASLMPEISGIAPTVTHQKEPEPGAERKVENFSISEGDDFLPVSDNSVPIIEGCSMDENPDEDVSLDPYPFLGNSMDDNITIEEVVPAVEEVVPAVEEVAPAVEEIAPAVEEIAPAVEEIAPAVEEVAPVAEEIAPAVEEIAPAVEEVAPAVEEVVPAVEEIAPAVEEVVPAVEKVAPAVEEIAPAVEEIAPAVEEIAPAVEEVVPAVEEIAPAVEEIDDFIPEEMGFIAESSPIIEETAEFTETASAVKTEQKPVEDLDFRRPDKPKASAENPEEEVHDGNLVYCRNCGQDMYDTEPFCKNCGAPYKGAYIPPKSAPSKSANKESPKVFGKIPLPKFIGIIAAILGVTAAVLFLVQPWRIKSNGGDLTGDKTQTSSSSSSTPAESSSSGNQSSSSSVSSSTQSNVSSAESSTSSAESGNSSAASSSSKASSSSSKKSSSSSSTVPVVTGTMSEKVKSLESDREKMMDAAAQLAGEVGKIEAFTQHIIYAMDTSSLSAESSRKAFYTTSFAKNMLSNLSSGKSTVDKAVSAASPKNSEYSSLYSSLKSLRTKYESYYNFIKSPSGDYSSFTSTCSSYASSFNSALSNLSLSKFMTSNYTAGNRNSAYASVVSAAVTAIKNSTSKLTTLQSKLTGLGSSFDSKVYSTLSDNMSTFASAAGYTYRVKAYSIMLSGVSSGYSSALTYITYADNTLQSLIETYSYIKENSLSNYKSGSTTQISNANAYANNAAAVVR